MPYVGLRAKEAVPKRLALPPQRRRAGVLRVAANAEDEVHAILARQARVLGTNAGTLMRRLGPKRLALLLGDIDWDSDWQAPMRAGLSKLVREELVRAGGQEAERIGLRTAFNADNPFALQFVREHVPALVRETTLETQVAIADVMKRGFLEQRTVGWMSTEIRQVVGLTAQQAGSVLRIRRAMEGQGATEAAIDKAADRQQARLLRYRSEVIARTETIRVSAAGTQAAWMQARAEGTLPKQAKRRWIAGPGERTCLICTDLAALDPVGIMEPFVAPGVGAIFLPPAHPACRCTVALVV